MGGVSLEDPFRRFSKVHMEIARATSKALRPVEPDPWSSLHSDLNLARTTTTNVLVVGSERAVVNFVRFLLPDLNMVDTIQRLDGRLLLPAASSRASTLVVHHVDVLTRDEQGRLLGWLAESTTRRMRVVSTASAPLLPLVEAGVFNEALYYRLNTIYIDLFE